MKFDIYKTIVVDDVDYKHSARRGYFDAENLFVSKFKKIIRLIPRIKQIELDREGETRFTVTTKTTIVLTKENYKKLTDL